MSFGVAGELGHVALAPCEVLRGSVLRLRVPKGLCTVSHLSLHCMSITTGDVIQTAPPCPFSYRAAAPVAVGWSPAGRPDGEGSLGGGTRLTASSDDGTAQVCTSPELSPASPACISPESSLQEDLEAEVEAAAELEQALQSEEAYEAAGAAGGAGRSFPRSPVFQPIESLRSPPGREWSLPPAGLPPAGLPPAVAACSPLLHAGTAAHERSPPCAEIAPR